MKRAPEASYEVLNGQVRRLPDYVERVGTPIPLRLSWRVLQAIRDNATTIAQIIAAVDAPPADVRKQLAQLRRAKLVRRRRGHYEVT